MSIPQVAMSNSSLFTKIHIFKHYHLKPHKKNTVYLYRTGFILILLLLDTQIMELSLVFSYLCEIGAF